ncbi:GL21332 [Drosophila persimilis]|uniref:GL21332 n=1 Tax=Drosophila persimilis TaxID=7234 RepID=B4HB55_DROPE|nr:GL21332 [Drosophila persimilis]
MERRGEWGLFSRRSDAEAHLIEITRVDGSRRAFFLGELAEASKRLLFWTDVSSHQAIIRARVDGNEHVDLEEVTTLALDQQSDIPCVSIKIRASMHISQVSAFGRFVSDDKTGLERSAITPVCTVAQSVSTSAWPAGYDTQYSRRMLVPDSDALMLLEGKDNYGVYPARKF